MEDRGSVRDERQEGLPCRVVQRSLKVNPL